MEQTVLIPINNIVDNPYQHREQEDPAAVEELAISIFRNGLQQYPAVRAVNSHYELVYGHTRRAAFRVFAAVMMLWLSGCAWGGTTYYYNYRVPVPQSELDTRVTTVPFKVWERVVPSWGENWSVHYEFKCWMLPGERYTVLGALDVDGMRYVESGRCNGDAQVP